MFLADDFLKSDLSSTIKKSNFKNPNRLSFLRSFFTKKRSAGTHHKNGDIEYPYYSYLRWFIRVTLPPLRHSDQCRITSKGRSNPTYELACFYGNLTIQGIPKFTARTLNYAESFEKSATLRNVSAILERRESLLFLTFSSSSMTITPSKKASTLALIPATRPRASS